MPENDKKLDEAKPTDNADAQPKQTAEPKSGAAVSKADQGVVDGEVPQELQIPSPHDIAKALNNDVILLLEAVVAAASHEDLRRCPALASICQAYQINRQSMIDWLERTKFRQAQREERRKAEKADKKSKSA